MYLDFIPIINLMNRENRFYPKCTFVHFLQYCSGTVCPYSTVFDDILKYMYTAFFHGIKKKEVLIVSNKGHYLGRIDISENRALFGEKIKALPDN